MLAGRPRKYQNGGRGAEKDGKVPPGGGVRDPGKFLQKHILYFYLLPIETC